MAGWVCWITACCAAPPGWRFEPQDLPLRPGIGYAVLVADIDGDGRPDLVVVDKDRVDWLQNPTWRVRPILKGTSKPDNVCVAAADFDGDGKLDLVLGAGWKPFDTAAPGTLQLLRRGASLDDAWSMAPIPCREPTVHRVRIIHDGKVPLVALAPLMGLGATAATGWNDGRPVKIVAYRPQRAGSEIRWAEQVLSQELHVVHGMANDGDGLLLGAAEGLVRMRPAGAWKTELLHPGNQDQPRGNRGASEIASGKLRGGAQALATIEPWHGHQVVAYVPGADGKLERKVLDDHLRWGHAVKWADLDGDGIDELIAGVRDDPDPKKRDAFTERRGVRVYRLGAGGAWERQLVDPGAVAVEDLATADFDGDGRPDLVAVGRQTHNARIYWNRKP